MSEDKPRTIASCTIDYVQDCLEPGYYYILDAPEGEETDPIGPFASESDAEAAFIKALEEAVNETVKQQLGLE